MKLSPSAIRQIARALADELEIRGMLARGSGAPVEGYRPAGIHIPGDHDGPGGYLYFIRFAGPGAFVKIGHTKSLRRRASNLQMGSPYPIVIEAYALVADPESEEVSLHERFSEHRIDGEWFRPCLALDEIIGVLRERNVNWLKYA